MQMQRLDMWTRWGRQWRQMGCETDIDTLPCVRRKAKWEPAVYVAQGAQLRALWWSGWVGWRSQRVGIYVKVQFSSVLSLSCVWLCDLMDSSTPGLPVHHQLTELTQTHIHWVNDAIQTSHPLSSPSPPTYNLSRHQGLFQWVSSSHQVDKVLEFQLQHQSFQWLFRTDFL